MAPPLPSDAQKAEQLAREIKEFLNSSRQRAAEAAQLALHHAHAEAARRYVQLGKQLEFAEKILGHAEVADTREYRRDGD